MTGSTTGLTLTAESFDVSLDEGVLVVSLNRPEKINSLTFQVYAELRDLFRALRDDAHPEVRVVLLRGEGPRGFCSGGDQHDIIAELFSRDMQGLVEFTRMTGALIAAIREARPPVVCALHRVVCGAGAVMSIACDVRVAADNTKIGFIFPQVGLCGADMGAAYLLPRIVGHGIASEILLTGDWVMAERAKAIGLVNQVVAVDEVQAAAVAFAKKLARGPAFAHAMTKRMLEHEATMTLGAAIEAEAQAQAICMQHPDFLEAHEAWKEKRDPIFR